MTGADATQNRAIPVCSAVRTRLLSEPISLTSLKSRANFRLDGGGAPLSGRNCEPVDITQGVTRPQPGSSAEAKAGGVGTHTPGAPAPGEAYNGNCAAAEPSAARRVRM